MSYDIVGNVLSVKDEEVMLWSYGYDELDRLVEAIDHANSKTWGWSYDRVGNRLSETLNGVTTISTFNSLNQLLQMGDARFWYDQAGNLAFKSTPEGSSAYKFDSRNRLVQVNTANDQQMGYTYDAFGQLRSSLVESAENSVSKSDAIDWVGPFSHAQVSEDNPSKYVAGKGLTYLSSHEGIKFIHEDPFFSSSATTDRNGGVNPSGTHNPWGADSTIATPGNIVPANFVGTLAVLTNSTTLHYMRERWYDTGLGRFISLDPMGTAGGINRYVYAGNNPLSYVDPLGLRPRRGDEFDPNVHNSKIYMGDGTAGATSMNVRDPANLLPEEGQQIAGDMMTDVALSFGGQGLGVLGRTGARMAVHAGSVSVPTTRIVARTVDAGVIAQRMTPTATIRHVVQESRPLLNAGTHCPFTAWLNEGPAWRGIYFGVRNMVDIVYVGMTNMFKVRQWGHGKSRFDLVPQIPPILTTHQAHSVEQFLMNVLGGGTKAAQRKGTTTPLLNVNNSLGETHGFYDEAMEWAENFLNQSYPDVLDRARRGQL